MLRSERRQCLWCLPTLVVPEQSQDDPHGFYATSASNLQVPEQIAATVAGLPEETRAQLKQLLRALDKPLMNLLFSGKFLRFRTLNQPQREAFLRGLASSNRLLHRQAFAALKRAAIVTYYTAVDADGYNPAWQAIGYPGPFSPPSRVPKPIQLTEVNSDSTLECDAVIIGSGAGGGVVAGELAAAGKAVVVLEMGSYYNEADFLQLEEQAFSGSIWAGAR